jgi:uncharacterized protein (DUF4415 family)
MSTSKRGGEKRALVKGQPPHPVKTEKHWSKRSSRGAFIETILRRRPNKATQLDPDDAPELTEEFFARADVYRGNKLIRAGRPRSKNPKLALKLRIDPDVVEHFRATGPGWQTRINDTLRRAAKLR